MTTIVSAFLTNVNEQPHYLDKYIQHGIMLLRANISKIIFVDEIMYEKIKEYENSYTKIILYKKPDSYLYPYINTHYLTNFHLNSTNPAKDTMEYIFTQCNKTEWVREAINLNYFDTDTFIWIDFGIRHVFNCSDDDFIQTVEALNNKKYDNFVRIGTIWNLNHVYCLDIYKDITWYFAGGVFGGNIESLLLFSNKMEEQCLKIISEEKTLMWEVNIWYLIYKDNKELFFPYLCDHNNTILIHY